MTEKAIEELNGIERPTNNPTEGENELNFNAKVQTTMYLLSKKKEVPTEDYELARRALQSGKPIIEMLRDLELEG